LTHRLHISFGYLSQLSVEVRFFVGQLRGNLYLNYDNLVALISAVEPVKTLTIHLYLVTILSASRNLQFLGLSVYRRDGNLYTENSINDW